jgi:PEP-CTERM/exosortase A-associated glycosyltransferase
MKIMSPLKILHILNHSLPFHSGYAFRTQNILQAQRKRGWQPVGLTAPQHNRMMKGCCQQEETVEGFRYYRTEARTPKGFSLYREGRLIAALTRRMREVVEIEKPDLLHIHSPVFNALAALRVERQMGIPMVYEIRAFWEDATVDQGTYRQDSWEYKLRQSLETWVCKKATHVAVLCQGLKGDLIKRGIPPAKLTIVANGVNVEKLTVCAPDAEYLKTWKLDGKRIIGFIGSFFRYEGLNLLVEAVAQLTISRSDIVLLLVGEGRMEAELKAQIERLHLTERVVMPGRIPHDRISGVYALMDVLAYPRYSIRLTELVTPLKPLEAMAVAKALVASDIGGHRELIQHGHTGLLFSAGDVAALAEVLTRLLDNTDLRQKLERQGFTWVRQSHSWDMTTAVYSDIYAKVLGNERTASGSFL